MVSHRGGVWLYGDVNDSACFDRTCFSVKPFLFDRDGSHYFWSVGKSRPAIFLRTSIGRVPAPTICHREIGFASVRTNTPLPAGPAVVSVAIFELMTGPLIVV